MNSSYKFQMHTQFPSTRHDIYPVKLMTPTEGHNAIAPAVGDRPLTTRSWVHFHSDPYWICGGTICTAKGFSQNTLVFPSHYHLINNSYSFIRLSLTQYNTKTICPWCLMDNKMQLNPVNHNKNILFQHQFKETYIYRIYFFELMLE